MKVQNPFPYTNDNKRYHTWNHALKDEFGLKVFKVALDAGFDCPNRDGTVAFGGCTFCSVAGSGDFAGDRVDPIDVQFAGNQRKNAHRNGKTANTWPISKRIQIHMLHLPKLKEKFEAALAQEGVVGIVNCDSSRLLAG